MIVLKWQFPINLFNINIYYITVYINIFLWKLRTANVLEFRF